LEWCDRSRGLAIQPVFAADPAERCKNRAIWRAPPGNLPGPPRGDLRHPVSQAAGAGVLGGAATRKRKAAPQGRPMLPHAGSIAGVRSALRKRYSDLAESRTASFSRMRADFPERPRR
jgi:hypothetical protein